MQLILGQNYLINPSRYLREPPAIDLNIKFGPSDTTNENEADSDWFEDEGIADLIRSWTRLPDENDDVLETTTEHGSVKSKDDSVKEADENDNAVPSTHLSFNPFEGIPTDVLEKAQGYLMTNKYWNQEQRAILNSLNKFQQGLMLYHGPGGTGKSALSSAISACFASADFDVCISSASNVAVDVATESFAREHPDLADKLLRFYPPAREPSIKGPSEEDEDLPELSDAEVAEMSIATIHLQLIKEMFDEAKHRNYGAQEFSLQTKVLRRAADGQHQLLMCFQKGGMDVGTPVDMYEMFRHYLERAQETHIKDWKEDKDPDCGDMTSKKKFNMV